MAETKELAFYYPNPMWSDGSWIKNLVLFFDGIALLVPKYMKERPEEADPAIVAGLKQHGLLEIIEPEKALDKSATESSRWLLPTSSLRACLMTLPRKKPPFIRCRCLGSVNYGD